MHVPYQSLKLAALACVRIYAPLSTEQVTTELKRWSAAGLIGGIYLPQGVPILLAELLSENQIEIVGSGNWRALPGRLEEKGRAA